ncbi:MAG TPA: Crp/Fnr family transcriptional regulator [Chitinophagaceae bacterium]|nr:Crp/Fnr family transcriptional regulator [Chitinophagaceae bacterium]
MPEQLYHHFRKFIDISEEDFSVIVSFFRTREVRKKENLLQEGQLCRTNYFVLKGCLRMFFINDKGQEQTTQFALENWWLSDYLAFQQEKAATFSIQAVETSTVVAIDFRDQQLMMTKFPVMERYFRMVYQTAFAASQMRIRYLYGLSREEMYLHFMEQYPGFVQRIPQYLLASFLGFTPEYLSELRAKRRS